MSIMEEQLVKFKTAKLAKEKGFNEGVYAYFLNDKLHYTTTDWSRLHYYAHISYPNVNKGYLPPTSCFLPKILRGSFEKQYIIYSAPTQSLLQRWLREEFRLSVKIDDSNINGKIMYSYIIGKLGSQIDVVEELFKSYEDALEEGLQRALKIIK